MEVRDLGRLIPARPGAPGHSLASQPSLMAASPGPGPGPVTPAYDQLRSNDIGGPAVLQFAPADKFYPRTVSLGSVLKARVVAVLDGPRRFFVRLTDDEPLLAVVEREIAVVTQASNREIPFEKIWHPGNAALCYAPALQRFVRANVLEVSPSAVKVFLVDHGLVIFTDKSHLRPFPPQLFQLKSLAILCTLFCYEISGGAGTVPTFFQDGFQEVVHRPDWASFDCHFIQHVDPLYGVDMLFNGRSIIDVLKIMVLEKFCPSSPSIMLHALATTTTPVAGSSGIGRPTTQVVRHKIPPPVLETSPVTVGINVFNGLDDFFLQVSEKLDTYKEVEAAFNKAYENNPEATKSLFSDGEEHVGEYVAFRAANFFGRGLIVGFDTEAVSIFSVDFGIENLIPKADVFHLVPEVAAVPALGFRAALRDCFIDKVGDDVALQLHEQFITIPKPELPSSAGGKAVIDIPKNAKNAIFWDLVLPKPKTYPLSQGAFRGIRLVMKISDTEFLAALTEDQYKDDFEKLKFLLSKEVSEDVLSSPSVGDFCLFKSGATTYRGRVERTTPLRLYAIDYGKIMDVEPGCVLKRMSSECAAFPAFSIRCQCDAIPVDFEGKAEAIVRFCTNTNGTWQVKFQNVFPDPDQRKIVDKRGGRKFKEHPGVELGKETPVTVLTFKNPGMIYVQLEENQDDFKELMNRIQSTCNRSHDELARTAIQCGEPVLVKYSMDQRWYRAVIEQVMANSVGAYFVDYGNSSTVPLDWLKPMNPMFLEFPKMLLKCCLGGIKASGKVPSGSYMDQFLGKGTVIFNSERILPLDKYMIDLYVGGRSVASKLISDGFAVTKDSGNEETGFGFRPNSRGEVFRPRADPRPVTHVRDRRSFREVHENRDGFRQVQENGDGADVVHGEERTGLRVTFHSRGSRGTSRGGRRGRGGGRGGFGHNVGDTDRHEEEMQTATYRRTVHVEPPKAPAPVVARPLKFDASPPVFSQGATEDVFVSFIENGRDFQFQLNSRLEEITEIASLLENAAKISKEGEFQVDEACIALWPEGGPDATWYRAKILADEGTKYYVRFVDYGNDSLVRKECVKVASPDLVKHKPQAFPGRLRGVDPENPKERFENVALNLVFKATFEAECPLGKRWFMTLVKEDGIIVNEIVECGGEEEIFEDPDNFDAFPDVKEIPTVEPICGVEVDAYISAVDSFEKISFQNGDATPLLEDMAEDLKNTYHATPPLSSDADFVMGAYCCVRYENIFYRAKVLRFYDDPQQNLVFLLDFGDYVSVEKDSMWPLLPKHKITPAQAYIGRLVGFDGAQPPDFQNKVKDVLLDLGQENPVRVTFQKAGDGKYLVTSQFLLDAVKAACLPAVEPPSLPVVEPPSLPAVEPPNVAPAKVTNVVTPFEFDVVYEEGEAVGDLDSLPSKVPAGAVACGLSGIQPTGDVWSEAAIREFKAVIGSPGMVNVHYRDVRGKRLLVALSLRNESTGDTYDVGDDLVKKGLAVHGPRYLKLAEGEHEGFLVCNGFDKDRPFVVFCPEENRSKLPDFMEDRLTLNVDLMDEKMKDFSPGAYCAVRSNYGVNEDRKNPWFRARILGVDCDDVAVRLIDLGQDMTVWKDDVRPLPPGFCHVPVFGVFCLLENFEQTESQFIHVEGDGYVAVASAFSRDQPESQPQSIVLKKKVDGQLVDISEYVASLEKQADAAAKSALVQAPRPKSFMGMKLVFTNGEFRGVVDTIIDPSTVIVHRVVDENDVKTLLFELKEFYSEEGNKKELRGIWVKSPCVIQVRPELYLRGIVSDVMTKNSIRVEAIDYGTFHIVPNRYCYVIDERFLDIPVFATRCRLDIYPLNEDGSHKWSCEATEAFETLLDDLSPERTFQFKVKFEAEDDDNGGHTYGVVMLDDSGTDVSDKFCSDGFARRGLTNVPDDAIEDEE